jgi:hypothetical protein
VESDNGPSFLTCVGDESPSSIAVISALVRAIEGTSNHRQLPFEHLVSDLELYKTPEHSYPMTTVALDSDGEVAIRCLHAFVESQVRGYRVLFEETECDDRDRHIMFCVY